MNKEVQVFACLTALEQACRHHQDMSVVVAKKFLAAIPDNTPAVSVYDAACSLIINYARHQRAEMEKDADLDPEKDYLILIDAICTRLALLGEHGQSGGPIGTA